MLAVTVTHESGVATLVCRGSIVDGSEGALLCAALGNREHNMNIDLEQVDAIDAAGRGAFIALQAAGVYLQLTHVSKPVRDMLCATGMDTIVEVREEQLICQNYLREIEEQALQPSSG
jgi:anti-anti-sigma regulatory factor